MTFEEFRQEKILKGEFRAPDPWDICRPSRKCNKPDLIKYEGRVYQVVERKMGKLKLTPLHGKVEMKMVPITSSRLQKV